MKIGIPKEIEVHEYRVGMTPAAVREAAARGHEVCVETGAGLGIDCSDHDYNAGGRVDRPRGAALKRPMQRRTPTPRS